MNEHKFDPPQDPLEPQSRVWWNILGVLIVIAYAVALAICVSGYLGDVMPGICLSSVGFILAMTAWCGIRFGGQLKDYWI